ncbi:PREDICTED: gamma-glutamylcyclotransferase [Gekko japonicus]|uniref:gamma-glutamylcyclotransferase n=1 Tax=Gekko japonicus TaxID=146911 RepID=A0ABM1K2P5_GEKJA|nr:PREDICTED: gamma-glutamylcyclotransferase [Gekko japonicus]XP_015267989.1 PREDICTED: gamma-glutamylcyclotransferase [Gekko japonicus]
METFKNCTCAGSGGSQGDCNSKEEHFLYFAYGSNLLRERITLKNPSAAFHAVAKLQDHKLAFGSPQGKQSLTWHGSTATILHSPGDEVWGIVWLMNSRDLSSLDKQEGVEGSLYAPIEINISTQEGKTLRCRSYQMNAYVANLPSPHYKKVICMGAKQNGLPTGYQKKLETIETNNYTGNVPVFEEIEAAISAFEKTT